MQAHIRLEKIIKGYKELSGLIPKEDSISKFIYMRDSFNLTIILDGNSEHQKYVEADLTYNKNVPLTGLAKLK